MVRAPKLYNPQRLARLRCSRAESAAAAAAAAARPCALRPDRPCCPGHGPDSACLTAPIHALQARGAAAATAEAA